MYCRWRQRSNGAASDRGTISTSASTAALDKDGLASFFNRRRKDDNAAMIAEKWSEANRAASQRGRVRGNASRSQAPGHMSISAPQPGSGPIRYEEERDGGGRPPLARQPGPAGQNEGSGETLTFVLADNESGSNSRESQDYLIGSNAAGMRERGSHDSNVLPATTYGGPATGLSGGGRPGRDTLSREYHEFMSGLQPDIDPRPAPAPPITSPTPLRTAKTRSRMI